MVKGNSYTLGSQLLNGSKRIQSVFVNNSLTLLGIHVGLVLKIMQFLHLSTGLQVLSKPKLPKSLSNVDRKL